ncbi:MAG: family 31 glucosidase [Lachnospiraceae bacterium]|nr:family 31 glucosidase [Lachnospiraceae bacterium]
MVTVENGKLVRYYDGEKLQIECWGKDSFRVRVTRFNRFTDENWALIEQEPLEAEIKVRAAKEEKSDLKVNAEEKIIGDSATITNGNICAEIRENGKLVFYNKEGKLLLAEYEYERQSSLGINTRELKGPMGNCKASMKWCSDPEEMLFGMGQYQNGIFNLKGAFLELAQRNSQASVPFVYSSLGYGFFWNNPAIGKVMFGTNMTEWEAYSTRQIDFWITAADTPAQVLSRYMEVTGKPPVMPEHGLGFWQCKLRYQTQEELLEVAREYHRRGIPLDVIIADFFHWTLEGTWAFDPQYWPDPKAMVEELNAMGTKLMVSIWPTVSVYSPNYQEMKDKGYLIRSETGVKVNMLMIDPTSFTDATNPGAREYLWNKVKENYVSYGITDFWLDVAEPEYSSYDFENYRYYKGANLEVGNEYPAMYTKTFFDGLKEEGVNAVNLVRCAWAGSQRYGALVWSGDINSDFETFKKQIICGMQMAMAGIPWWTTDIGGFHNGNIHDPAFQELLIRWFQYGAFCPVMRLHGCRHPEKAPMSNVGGGRCASGAENEIWSYGEANYEIMKSYIELRERMRPYTRAVMDKASAEGCPIIRPLFYNFPADKAAWEIKDQFMFGDDILVAPVTEAGQTEKKVYVPAGSDWADALTGEIYKGGQWITTDTPIEKIPVYVRADRYEELKYIFG